MKRVMAGVRAVVALVIGTVMAQGIPSRASGSGPDPEVTRVAELFFGVVMAACVVLVLALFHAVATGRVWPRGR